MTDLTGQNLTFLRLGILNNRSKSQAKVHSWVREKTTNTGTNTTIIGLSAIPGYIRFGTVLRNGEEVYYTIDSGGDKEVGLGRYINANRLSRDRPLYTLVNGVYNGNPSTIIALAGRSSIVTISVVTKALEKIEEAVEARNLMLLGSF